MAATWPGISGVQYDSIVLSHPEQRQVFGTDAGPPKTAALAEAAEVHARFDVVLDGAELSIFQSWFEDELELGEQAFEGLEGVVGDNPSAYRFLRTPVFREIRGGSTNRRLWRATFELRREGRARFVTHAGQYVTSGAKFVVDA